MDWLLSSITLVFNYKKVKQIKQKCVHTHLFSSPISSKWAYFQHLHFLS